MFAWIAGMCAGVYYSTDGADVRLYFPNPKAQLPVKMRDGHAELLPWGRRHEQSGELPLGGWARLDGIYAGRWDRWMPVPVRLPVLVLKSAHTGRFWMLKVSLSLSGSEAVGLKL